MLEQASSGRFGGDEGAEGYKGYTTSPLFRLLPRVVRAGHGGSVGEAPTRIDRPIQRATGIMAWIRGCRTAKRTNREYLEGVKKKNWFTQRRGDAEKDSALDRKSTRLNSSH